MHSMLHTAIRSTFCVLYFWRRRFIHWYKTQIVGRAYTDPQTHCIIAFTSRLVKFMVNFMQIDALKIHLHVTICVSACECEKGPRKWWINWDVDTQVRHFEIKKNTLIEFLMNSLSQERKFHFCATLDDYFARLINYLQIAIALVQ